jgi:hypothetical protein
MLTPEPLQRESRGIRSTRGGAIKTNLLRPIVSALLMVATFGINDSATLAGASLQCAAVPIQLTAWWRAEGDGTDLTGNHDGVLTGDVDFAAGEVGQSFNFTVAGQHVDITPGFQNKVRDNFTIEFWAFPSAERQSTPESNEGIAGVGGQRYAIFPTHGGDFDPSGTGAGAGVSVGTNGISIFEHAANFLPSPLVYDAPIVGWTHIALVYQAKQPSLYVNGALVRTGMLSQRGYVFPGQTLSDEGNGYGPYLGRMDEVTIYNRSMTADEISAIYEAGPEGKCKNILFIRLIAPAAVRIFWASRSDRKYQLESRTSFANDQWAPLGEARPGSGTTMTADRVAADAAAYYRLAESAP